MIDVAVVIPAHNRAHTLPACLESVLAQTHAPKEIWVVDDRSTDDTAAVVARHAARGVRYLRLQQGRGAQAARNAGIHAATAPWIAFQDSDDTWLPQRLALQVEALRAAGAGADTVVHGDGLKRTEPGGRVAPLKIPLTEGRCHALLLQRPGPLFPALLASRQALADCGYLDEDCPSYQEWDTAIRLARRCRFIHVRQPLFTWVRHAGETISRSGERAVRGFAYVIERHRDEIVAAHGARGWHRQRLELIALALQNGQWQQARAFAEEQPARPGYAVARWLARAHLAPRGLGRVLRSLA
jgi:glycosyltransferase involved in cell wall biosynthesis